MTFRAGAPRCPTCGEMFEDVSVFETRALRCAGCSGVWFDALDGDNPPAPNGAGEPHVCPRCEHELQDGRIAGASGLVCVHCRGAFLPRSSFGSLLDEPRRVGTMPPARPDHVRILAVVRAISSRAPRAAIGSEPS